MGFSVVEGPEVELDHYNFEMLNIPAGPSRAGYVELPVGGLRERRGPAADAAAHPPHRRCKPASMEAQDPPVRVIVPGKCYRYEATDATHEWHFYQIEGLAGGRGHHLRQPERHALRIRPPRVRPPTVRFGSGATTSPSSSRASICRSPTSLTPATGKRPINRDEDWIEVMGAGMVHPRVLEGVGYDPQRYTGFAFGMGPERIGMLKYGIDDIRHFYRNDVRFLRQF